MLHKFIHKIKNKEITKEHLKIILSLTLYEAKRKDGRYPLGA